MILNLSSVWTYIQCSWSLEDESVSHFFLHCFHFRDIGRSLFYELEKIDINILGLPENEITHFLMDVVNIMQSSRMINAATDFIIKSQRSDGPLFWS